MPETARRRRLQVRLSPELMRSLEACCARSGVAAGAFVRLLVEEALASEPACVAEALRSRPSDQLPALAGLVAAEHVLGLLTLIVPSGQERVHELRPGAVSAAEWRLADLRQQFEQEAR